MLEKSESRVGGANIDELVVAAAGVNLWVEWARIELTHLRGEAYVLPPIRQEYAGLILCLARQNQPELSAYSDGDIVWRLRKENHAGLLVASATLERVQALLGTYAARFSDDFLVVLPPSIEAQV